MLQVKDPSSGENPGDGSTFTSKIVDLRLSSGGIVVSTSGRSGNGHYGIVDPEELESILIGLVRRHKYNLADKFSSNLSRHIPDSVRRDVWQRDQGRCVRCHKTDYLEFDHIIPHSKGGASTTANVQILCRRCNGQKGDRI